MEEGMKISNVFGALVCSMFLLGGGIAFAGEVDGQGNPIPGGETGKSPCSFSGQQDDPVADEGFFKGDRVQSWGQIPKFVRDIIKADDGHPGGACNPNGGGEH
jgi:hypothetical protein